MRICDEIYDAMVNGATPMFLAGIIEMARDRETREVLKNAILEVETGLYGGMNREIEA
jgi:hypothetical protein